MRSIFICLLGFFFCNVYAAKVYTISALPDGYTEAAYVLELEGDGLKFRNGKTLETTYSSSTFSSSEELKIVLTKTDIYLLSPSEYIDYRAGSVPSISFAKRVKNLKIGVKLTTTGVTTATLLEAYEAVYIHTVGNKQYECTDHLGNVAAVVTDQKLAITTGLRYRANLLSATEYYPFGAPMPERSYSSPSYRYGFNGMEKDDEVKGSSGTSYDFGARMYDSRLGRFKSIDSKFKSLPFFTPYSFASNKPILMFDLRGENGWVATANWTYEDVLGFETFIRNEIQRITEVAAKKGMKPGDMCDDASIPEVCFDCADFAISMLIRYAAENGKEVSFHLASGQVVNSSSTTNITVDGMKLTINDQDDFERVVRGFSNAESVLADMELLEVDEDYNIIGDVRVGDVTNTGAHVQVITGVERGDYGYETTQGTLPPEIPRKSSSWGSAIYRWDYLDINNVDQTIGSDIDDSSVELDIDTSNSIWATGN